MTKHKKFFEDKSIQALYEDQNYEKSSENELDDLFHETTSYWINKIRLRQNITQKQIASTLHISQPGVCQMLKRPATIAKLWRLCAAMGGTLEVNIRIGDEVVSLIHGVRTQDTESTQQSALS
jgi:predicted XRE-type DNA-binding protein